MVMGIKQLLEEAHREPSNGKLDLGIANGWDEHTRYLMNGLRVHRIPGSGQERNLGRCYNEYTFTVKDEEMELEITYRVDSGD